MTVQESTLRRIAEKIPSILAYIDSTLHCRFASAAYERWFGLPPGSAIGAHASEFLGPLFRLNLPYMQAALRGEPQEFERDIPSRVGGPPRHSLVTYIPDRVGGEVRGFIVVVTDISLLKRTELALRVSEAKFSGIITVAQDAIITIDDEQRVTIFNQGAEQIFGYASSEIIGTPIERLVPARFREAHKEHIRAFAAEPGAVTRRMHSERQAFALRKNGEEFPIEGSISRFDVGGTRLLTVALRDITEGERAAREQRILAETGAVLASSLDYEKTIQQVARLVVDTVADMCVVDVLEDGENIVRLSAAHADPSKAEACAKLTRLSLTRRTVLARSSMEAREPKVFSEMSDDFLRAAAASPEHLDVLHELGPPRSAIVAPLVTTNGVIGAIVMSSLRPNHFQPRDVPLAMELARRAAMAIENARLYETARRATNARDDALAIVAHDVRNPIATIHLAATGLDRALARGQPVEAESVRIILRAAKRANRLIQDLLDISRIEGGALSLAREGIIPQQLVADAADAQRLLASAANVTLDSNVSEDLPQISGDRHRLLQVFENLIGNAMKFVDGSGRITIGVERRDRDVVFSIADTGPGIAPESLEHVFDRFWQADRLDSKRGAGLGLPICKGIVEAHGGRIWVESELGRGTTFYFTIPAIQRDERG